MKENEKNLSGEDIREGITAIINVKLLDPNLRDKQKQNLVMRILDHLQKQF